MVFHLFCCSYNTWPRHLYNNAENIYSGDANEPFFFLLCLALLIPALSKCPEIQLGTLNGSIFLLSLYLVVTGRYLSLYGTVQMGKAPIWKMRRKSWKSWKTLNAWMLSEVLGCIQEHESTVLQWDGWRPSCIHKEEMWWEKCCSRYGPD